MITKPFESVRRFLGIAISGSNVDAILKHIVGCRSTQGFRNSAVKLGDSMFQYGVKLFQDPARSKNR